ncbi:MAG: rhomboid family intramembrane serine protease [Nitrospirae bacterium]|nr:rhomboid family intramembrane serine protease [Nitrospirota bacterium]
MLPLRDANPTRRVPVLTIGLVAANVLVYLYEAVLPEEALGSFVLQFGAIPREITRLSNLAGSGGLPPLVSMVTSMFVHGGLAHLLGNMLYLWIFGDNVEDRLGRPRFVLFYLLCGLAAALGHVVSAPGSEVPMVGASGAISGVLGAYVRLFPRARVMTLVFLGWYVRIVPLPAAFVLGVWFVIQVLNGLPSLAFANFGGVAWFAHVGGFLAGYLLVRRMERPR